ASSTGAGTGTFTAEQANGLRAGSLNSSFGTPPGGFRFDMNGTGNVTQAGYTPVRGGTVYTPVQGYGWQASVADFDRGAVAGRPNDNLLRDGNYGSAPGTFQLDVLNGTYQVTVTIGDRTNARDNIRISAEGGPLVVVPNTAANAFTNATIGGVV